MKKQNDLNKKKPTTKAYEHAAADPGSPGIPAQAPRDSDGACSDESHEESLTKRPIVRFTSGPGISLLASV